MAKRGRPPKVKPNGEEVYNIAQMCKLINEYIESHKKALPILKECCLLNNWDYDYVMKLQSREENQDLRQSIKKLLSWKEINLEKGALTGKFDKTMAIFSLKQPAHGWTDKVKDETDKTTIDLVTSVLEEVRKKADNNDGI